MDPARRTLWAAVFLLALLASIPRAVAGPSAPEAVPLGGDAITRAPPPLIPVGEVAVTATRSERSVLDTPGNLTIIDRAAIERSQASGVAELLRREAGLFVLNLSTNPDGYQVDARGFNDGGGNGSSLLVLVNGHRLNEPDSSSPDWGALGLDRVERIEVLRGPASAAYGDGAVSGVVNVVTRASEGPVRLELRGRSGTYDTDGGSLFARGTAEALSASLFLDRLSTDGYRDQSGFRSHRGEASARYALGDRIVLGLDAGYASDARERPGALSREQMRLLGRRAANPLVEDDELDRRRLHLNGLVEIDFAEGVAAKLAPFYRERSDRGTITLPPDSIFVSDTDTRSVGLNAQLQIDGTLLRQPNRLLLGIDLLSEDVEVDAAFGSSFGTFPSDNDTGRHLYGAFVQEELQLTDALLLSLGTRYDYARVRGEDPLAPEAGADTFRYRTTFWSPKAALTARLAEAVSAYVSYARGFRVPNIDEAFGFFGFDPALDAEKSDAYEVGLKLRRSRVSANLAIYWMQVDDQILFHSEILAPDPFTGRLGPAPRNVNFDRVRHRGLETSASCALSPWLDVYGSYTYDDTEIRRDSITDLEGNQLPITPRHRGTAGVVARLPYWIEAGLNANYVGRRYAANDLRNELRKLSKYASYDASLAFRPPLGEALTLHLTLLVRNLFDREYSEFGGERTFVPGELGFHPSPGRTYQVGLGITWQP